MADMTPTKTVRLSDVAKAAGVSQGTVSNVFNHPEIVRREVRERVHKAADEIGYKGPDPKGRLLRAGKVNAIGVATTKPLSYFFEDPYARAMMAGITKACEASGTGISLVSAATEDLLNWNMSNALVDGFILFCLGGAERLIARSRERFLPFVALAFSDTADVPAIDVDNVAGGRIAAEHLVGLGHTRFGILAIEFNEGSSGPWSLKDMATAALPSARDRIVGSFEVLSAAGTDVATIPVFECLEEAGTVHMALEALFSAAAPPTALIAQSDAIAMIALDWLTAHGLSVPQDVSIIGFDGVPEAALSSPPLTTVAQPIAEIARRAVAAILDRSEETESVLFDPELIVRASTAPPPGR